jgi:hypothetical protein
VTLGWDAIYQPDQPGTGVTFCYPEEWTLEQPAVNTPALQGSPRITMQLSVRIDHAEAVDYLASLTGGGCPNGGWEDYGARVLQIGGWPAVEQSYVAPAPICGECDPPTEPLFLAHADAFIAAGVQVLTITASAPEQDQQSLNVLFDVAETVTIDNGETPIDTAGDLSRLYQAQAETCQ